MHSTFDEVENTTIQTWNRYNTLLNIGETHSDEYKRSYLAQFDKGSLLKIYLMSQYVEAHSYAEVKREVFREEPVGE